MADRHTADTITDDELDALYEERDRLRRNLRRALTTAEVANARATSAEDAIERVVAITEEHPAGIDTALILAALDDPTTT